MKMLRANLGVLIIKLGYFVLPRDCRAYIDRIMNLGMAAQNSPAPPTPQKPVAQIIPAQNCASSSFRLH